MNNRISYNASYFIKEVFAERFSKDISSNVKIKEIGLLKGVAGVALIYYLLSKQTGYQVLEEKGAFLLDFIGENSHLEHSLNFGTGITGIGWCIEWLVQNDLLKDTNTDDVLASIDNGLYKKICYSKNENIRLFDGLLGHLWYFTKRALSINPETHRYKRIGHSECLILLTDDLESYLSKDEIGISKFTDEISKRGQIFQELPVDLQTVREILISISLLDTDINTPTIDSILNTLITYLNHVLSNITTKSNFCKDPVDALYSAIAYLIIAKNRQNKMWESDARLYIENCSAILEKTVNREDYSSLFKRLSVLSLLNLYLPSDQNRYEIERLISKLSAFDIDNSLYCGRGALVIAELCLNNSDLVSNWHELLF